MQTNNGTNERERAMQELYLRRINDLGKCLLLWASRYSEFGLSFHWRYAEINVDNLTRLLDEMADLAYNIDEKYVRFWAQIKSVLSKVDERLPKNGAF